MRRQSNFDLIPSVLSLAELPSHVAFIMDGNGRWAKAQGKPRTYGHEHGEKALYDVIYGALDLGIEWVTVYAFSTENWKRSITEVSFLMNFNQSMLLKHRDELNEAGVRIRVMGLEDSRIPRRVVKDIREAEKLTENNTRLNFNIAFNYGGRADIVSACKSIIDSGIDSKKLNEDVFAKHLLMPEMPNVDLMVRSSGEKRLSNFLLWQCAYSEFIFREEFWPEFNRELFFDCLIDYQTRLRRYGS
jgi:undecaprenyl diphosphate synthase